MKRFATLALCALLTSCAHAPVPPADNVRIIYASSASAIIVGPRPSPQVIPKVTAVRVGWTAPGDDGKVGTAKSYDLRYSLSRPDTTRADSMAAWWKRAGKVTGIPAPMVSGTPQEAFATIPGGIVFGLIYSLVMTATDEAGNISPWSNVLRFVVRP